VCGAGGPHLGLVGVVAVGVVGLEPRRRKAVPAGEGLHRRILPGGERRHLRDSLACSTPDTTSAASQVLVARGQRGEQMAGVLLCTVRMAVRKQHSFELEVPMRRQVMWWGVERGSTSLDHLGYDGVPLNVRGSLWPGRQGREVRELLEERGEVLVHLWPDCPRRVLALVGSLPHLHGTLALPQREGAAVVRWRQSPAMSWHFRLLWLVHARIDGHAETHVHYTLATLDGHAETCFYCTMHTYS